MTGRRILVFSRDPGGTNAVMPLIQPLRDRGNEVTIYGKDSATAIYRRANLECSDIRELIPSAGEEHVCEFVRKIMPNLILTGTSSEDFTERQLWKAAVKVGVPSCAVLDQWTNYRLRLTSEKADLSGQGCQDGGLVLPSVMFVMDELARKEMCALGIDSQRLVVTGQPYFDYIRNSAGRFSAPQIGALRRQFMGDEGGKLWVFASQPLVSLHRQNGMPADYWGYTEQTILDSVIAFLGKLTTELGKKVTLVMRLHPKDEPDAYRNMLATLPGMIRIVFDRDTDSSLLLKSADLVIGMFSMMLLEAAILGRHFLSVQIGLKRENPFIFDRIGLTLPVLNEDRLQDLLRRALRGKNPNDSPLTFEFGATERIVNYLEGYQ